MATDFGTIWWDIVDVVDQAGVITLRRRFHWNKCAILPHKCYHVGEIRGESHVVLPLRYANAIYP